MLLKIFMGVFLLLVLLCAVLSGSISKILTKPLSELSKVSREITCGNLSRRAEIKQTMKLDWLQMISMLW